jgi:hypothetical protein
VASSLILIKNAGGVKTIAEGAPKAAAPAGGGFLATVGRWATTFGAALLGGVAAGSVNAVEGGAGQSEAEKQRNRRNRIGSAAYFNNLPSGQSGGASWWMRLLLGAAAEPGFNFRNQLGMSVGGMAGGSNSPSDVSVVGVPEVSIPGPITTQPSGTQDVRVTNPTPAPVVNITVNAQTNDPQGIVAAVEKWASDKLNALSRSAYSDGAN